VTELKVWPIDWGTYLVRGTDDVALAQAALRDHLLENPSEFVDNNGCQFYIDQLRPQVGWYRCNPCTCGEEHHSFDMMEVSGPARGNFVGVFYT
jgi:hypothetical protein